MEQEKKLEFIDLEELEESKAEIMALSNDVIEEFTDAKGEDEEETEDEQQSAS